MRRCLFLLTTSWSFVFSAKAQTVSKPDTSYYRSFSGSVVPRVFFSRNYSHLIFDAPGSVPTMNYHANTPLNLGIGMAYRYFSFSISKGLGFLQSDSKKGHTGSFDLQTHIYRRKWVFDVLAQFYHGYYLYEPTTVLPLQGSGYYIRPDMRLRTVGLTGYRVLNDRKFSYGAVLGQGAMQQRSAGSFLIGGNAFYTAINADSAFAPSKLDSTSKDDVRKMHLFLLGAGIGYAYTYVYQKHWFLLGSANVNVNLNFSKELGNGIQSDKVALSHNFIFRLGTGYNQYKWGLSLLWFTEGLHAKGQHTGYNYSEQTGSYKLIYVRRIAVDRHMKHVLNTED